MSELPAFSKQLLLSWLRPNIVSDLPGRLRLAFPAYRRLPAAALPYLHYINDAMCLMPGILSAESNARIGTMLIRYNAGQLTRDAVMNWLSVLAEEGIALAEEMDFQKPGLTESGIVRAMEPRLRARLNRGGVYVS